MIVWWSEPPNKYTNRSKSSIAYRISDRFVGTVGRDATGRYERLVLTGISWIVVICYMHLIYLHVTGLYEQPGWTLWVHR